MPGAWLILPTYNEAENLERIVCAALPRLAEATPDHRVLVVDDGSPDGTGEIADRLAAELAPVEVLHRTAKEGVGRAGPAGLAGASAARPWRASSARWPPALTSCSRWTRTSRTTHATCRG